MILKFLKENALKQVGQKKIRDVRIGLSYTAVQLEDLSVGVAMTFHHDIPQGCLSMGQPLKGSLAADIIEKAESDNLLERTLAIAAMNAVTNHNSEKLVHGDSLELLKAGKDDVVGMVGFFGPLVSVLKNEVKALHIFEKSVGKSENLHTENEIESLMPQCSVAIITSTSLINRTFEKVVKAASGCHKIALVGASTPLVNEIFADYGVSLLSGLVIRETDEVLRVISESGGMRSFSRYTDKVNLVI
jgi:uncharacterized protein